MKQPFQKVVAEHADTVLRVCRVVVGRHDAEDAWSETFLSALRAYPDLPADANVQAWLVTIAHRKSIDIIRRQQRHAIPVERLPERPSTIGIPTSESHDVVDQDLWDALGALPPKQRQAQTLDRLHRALGEQAEREGLLDIAYTTIDTPVGALLLASTERGLVRVAYEREDHDKVLETLSTRLSPRILRAPRRLDEAAHEIDQYFAGTRTRFDLTLDLSLSGGFRRLVQRHLPEIRYGQTQSYAQVAQLVGNPRAVRAVGTACATNPLPVVVPCHRVVRADGAPGGYIGGLAAKTALLNLEATR